MSQQKALTPLTREQVVADIADALGVPPAELSEGKNLFDAGLDSVRVMLLIEKWRAAGSVDADFPTLASDPFVGQWVEVVLGEDDGQGGSR